MSVSTFTKSGAKATTSVKLDKKVFGVEVKDHGLLKIAYQAYLANGRVNLAKTKKRGEVRGGGRKPHPQKGTGRARAGSSRNPLQTGGGVTFGPTGSENYFIKLNTRSRRLALRQALSLAAKSEKIIVIDDFVLASGKTKDALNLLIKIGASGKTLIVLESKTPETSRPIRNLPGTQLIQARYLNVYGVLNADKIVFSTSALLAIDALMEAK
ncbi:50S ribosomal protein L4 [Candidatus Saccharibacteria bacterium]|nr:50S ribosomal protein L4 [Candidatus Saccharibacteria bacterium]